MKCSEDLFVGRVDVAGQALGVHEGHEFTPVGLVELLAEDRIPVRGGCHALRLPAAAVQYGRVPITEARSITRTSG